jgi:BirA family transcriptional regulator, biotin operon repressor / biotin---[acetyl-CoA-carboxylase] ligase
MGRPLLQLEEATSTNDVAKEMALQGAAEGLVVVAARQTKGRGRRGRVWESPPGAGLYFSALLRPGWPAAEAPWLGVLAGLAACQAARSLGAARATVKWPNDVMVDGRKLGGVLVEPRIAAGRVEFAVLGIGINVVQEDWPPGLRDTAVSLRQLGVRVDLPAVREALCRSISDLYCATDTGVVAALDGPWREATGGQPLPVLS